MILALCLSPFIGVGVAVIINLIFDWLKGGAE